MVDKNIRDIEQYLIDFYELEQDQAANLITEMRGSIIQKLNNIKKSINDEDHEQIAKIAHSLKGTLLNFGLGESAAMCSKIDKSAREDDSIELIAKWYSDLCDDLIQFTESD